MNAAATCPWCGAILADPRPQVCPSCHAALVPRSDVAPLADGSAIPGSAADVAMATEAAATTAGGDPLVPGLTVAKGSPTSFIRATDPLLAEALTTSPFRPNESDEGVAPPTDDVRRLIRQMELERLAADIAADHDIAPPDLDVADAADVPDVPDVAEVDTTDDAPAADADPTDDPDGSAAHADPLDVGDDSAAGVTNGPEGSAAVAAHAADAAPTAAGDGAGSTAGATDAAATTDGADGAELAMATGPSDVPAGAVSLSPLGQSDAPPQAPPRTAPQRQPAPGPSFVREEPVIVRSRDGTERRISLGMSAPSIMDDGWWLAHLWAADADGIVDALAVTPAAGPPPTPPLLVLGPAFAGALSGLLAQEDGRQLVRIRLPPAADERRPWERPLLVWLAVKWDAVRASVMRPNELAREVLRAFARAVEAAARPG